MGKEKKREDKQRNKMSLFDKKVAIMLKLLLINNKKEATPESKINGIVRNYHEPIGCAH